MVIAFYCIVLYCIALHCIALLCFALHFIEFYYIDTSVLLENIPLVKFIKTTLTREFIDDVMSVISLYYFIDVLCLYNKPKTIFYSPAALVRKILFCH